MRGVRKTSEGVSLLAVKVGFLLWWLFIFCGHYASDSPYIIIVCMRIHGSSFLRKRRPLHGLQKDKQCLSFCLTLQHAVIARR